MATSSYSPHVAVLALPFASHPNTLHALATLLASAAPHAFFSYVSSTRSCAPLANLPGAPANLSLHGVSDGCEEIFRSGRRIDRHEVAPLFHRATPGNYVEGMRRAVGERGGAPVTCIVCDVLLVPHVAAVAEDMGVPLVAFRTGGTSALSCRIYTDEIRSNVGVGKKVVEEQKLDFIPSLSAFQVSDLPEGIVHGNLELPMFKQFHLLATQLSCAAAVALNTSAVLEGPVVADLVARTSKCLPVGPLNLLLPDHQPNAGACDRDLCLSWLDRHEPDSVVYVAFGTLISLEEPELAAIAEALESTGTPFLWSLKEGGREKLPKGFLDRENPAGLVVPWVPQAEVLRHKAVGAFMTHCGWKSVVESVAGGVPMICRPFFGDQRLNARQVVEVWRTGVWVEGDAMRSDAVAAALQRVVGSGEGKAMRERARGLGEKAREATAEGGSSRESLKELVEMVCGGSICMQNHAAVVL